VPLGLFAAYNVWAQFFTQTAPCPTCGEEVTGAKGGEAVCFNCGASVVARDDDTWALPSQYASRPSAPQEERGTPKGYRGPGAREGVIDVDVMAEDD
jgi:predicted RNA-binding Zn-ribbon protein involved in translation (DUF1610 family)